MENPVFHSFPLLCFKIVLHPVGSVKHPVRRKVIKVDAKKIDYIKSKQKENLFKKGSTVIMQNSSFDIH